MFAEVDVVYIEGEVGTYKGIRDYDKLKNLPSIENVELVGNKTAAEIGLATVNELDAVKITIAKNATSILDNEKTIGVNSAAITENSEKIAENTANIEKNAQALEILNGTGEGSVSKKVIDEISKVVAEAPEEFDTLKELSDWLYEHEDSAAAMNVAIKENEAGIKQNKADIASHVTDLKNPHRVTAEQVGLGKVDNMSVKEIRSFTAEVSGESISITDGVDFPLIGLNLYGKSTQDGTPDPTNPVPIVSVGDDGELKATACGKNLFDYHKCLDTITPGNGVSFVNNKDGTFTISGEPTEAKAFGRTVASLSIKEVFPCPGTYCLNSDVVGMFAYINLAYNDVTISSFAQSHNERKVFEITDEMYAAPNGTINVGFYITVANLSQYASGTYYIQIEVGNTATDFEPYKGNIATITSALPLCGKGSVYDELIYRPNGTAKAVKRFNAETFEISTLNKETLTNTTLYKAYTEKVSNGSSAAKLCNVSSNYGYHTLDEPHYYVSSIFNIYVANEDVEAFEALGTVTVMYDLSTPEEIELTAEEMAQLEQLYSYNGVTNVFNDEGAEMAVKYCADSNIPDFVSMYTTKLQNQISELEKRISALEG